MLITFKSKAAADVLMYEEHAKRILDLLGKDIERGIITPEETGQAVALLEEEFARSREQSAAEDARLEAEAESEEDEEAAPASAEVPFATRLYPLLEMLRAAHQQQKFVTWGV